MRDKKTAAYFDAAVPEYDNRRLKEALDMVNRFRAAGSSLVDIGCGTGGALEFFKKETGISELCGIDISEKSLSKARQRTGCETFTGSILEKDLPEKVSKRYDFALLLSVLHHLIGRTRGESVKLAELALRNALALLKRGGYLIVEEPTYSTTFAMAMLFYIKKLTTTITSDRITLGRRLANNIGAPVVSFYSDDRMIKMLSGLKDVTIADINLKKGRIRPSWRLALITRSGDLTVAIRKDTD